MACSSRNDIAKTLSGLGLSGTQSSSTNPLHRGPPGSASANATRETKQKLTLLTLPAEIRLLIYDILLISRFDPGRRPWAKKGWCSWWELKGKKLQKIFPDTRDKGLQYKGIETALLRTCKQIYYEAIPVLYSHNVFSIRNPDLMIPFIVQIGPTNITLIRSMDVFIPMFSSLPQWIRLFNILSLRARGLRFMEVEWGLEHVAPVPPQMWQQRGLGDQLSLVRALADLRQLERLKISGYYAKQWPSYLRREMGVRVEATRGQYSEYIGPQSVHWVDKLNQESLWKFEAYQVGTDDLTP